MENLIKENYNSKVLVEMWDDFIDWKKRRKGENNFLIKNLKKFSCNKIFDACLGTGIDSIYLRKEGFEVVSNDLDKTFISKAKENAKKEKVVLNITSFDWRELKENFEEGIFDAIICLGNSLTYLFSREDQIKALNNFLYILKKGGILIIDERNYQYILNDKKKILEGDFDYSGKYVYCGNKVHARPIEISKDLVKFEYVDTKTKNKGYLKLYPFKKNELFNLLKKAGFGKIEIFSDYKKEENSKADFFQYVCVKH